MRLRRRLLLAAPAAALLAVATVTTFAAPASAGTVPQGAVHIVAPQDTCTVTSTLAGDHYSAVQIAQTAQANGFSGDGLVTSVAIALAESGGWTQAVLVDSDCSRDRGLWQINSYWHSEVSDAQAFDPNGCAQAAYGISSAGADWSQWSTYTSGAYQNYLAEAQQAVAQIGG